MGMKFLSGGLLTTVQDAGRFGYQQFGVPVSGAVDPRSLALANLLVGNDEREAALEITLLGPSVEFTASNVIALTGADLSATLNGAPLARYCAVRVKAGDRLAFGAPKAGFRAYLAVAGGFALEPVMGSRSTYLKAKLGGLEGRKLGRDDLLAFRAPSQAAGGERIEPEDFSGQERTLRVVLGPQDDAFPPQEVRRFFESVYTVTDQSDRMGSRLDGPAIAHIGDGNIISDGISFGAIQIPADGKPIVMLADRQTTGGYTKIANVITVDLPLIAQSRPGDRIRFVPVGIEEAQRLYLAQRERFDRLREQLRPAPTRPGRVFRAWVEGREYLCTVTEC